MDLLAPPYTLITTLNGRWSLTTVGQLLGILPLLKLASSRRRHRSRLAVRLHGGTLLEASRIGGGVRVDGVLVVERALPVSAAATPAVVGVVVVVVLVLGVLIVDDL